MLSMTRRRDHGVVDLAYYLADTGKFTNWLQIEWELRFERGLPSARHLLDGEYIRNSLE